MYAESRNIFENNQVEFFLEEGSLYDKICFRYEETPNPTAYSNTYRLHTPLVPVQFPFSLRIRPSRSIPEGWYKGTFRDFGDFHLIIGNVAPKITPLGALKPGANLSRLGRIAFAMSDASGIKSYRAELDGKWLMFSRRSNVLTYTFDEHCPPGNHTLKLTVTDIADNESTYTLTFKR